MKKTGCIICSLIVIVVLFARAAVAQPPDFSYQGGLHMSGSPANGNFDFEFALFDSAATQVGTTQTRTNVAVTDGVFSVQLNFGSQFPGANRFLEIRVRPAGGGAFTTLAPRQPVNSSPYSIKSLSADIAATATNAAQLGGVAANQYVLTGDARLSDARPASSVNFFNATLTGVVPVVNGGTGSITQNFVDLTNAQTVGGGKTFSSTLRVANGASLAAAASSADLVVEDNSSAFLHFLTPDDFESGVLFGEPAASIAGGIIFNNASTNNGIQFRTGGNNTRMTLDGSGNLAITGTFSGNVSATDITSGTLNNARLGIVPIANGGTGSATQNFVDLTSAQSIGGVKTFSGNFGIGAANPAAKFHVIGNSSSAATPVAIVESSGSQVPLLFRSGATEVARIRADSDGNLVLATLNGTDRDIYFRAGGDSGTDMFIQSSSGNVGIGTDAPGHALTIGQADTPIGGGAKFGIYGAGQADMIVRDTDVNVEGVFASNAAGVIFGSLTNHPVTFRSNNVARMIIDTDVAVPKVTFNSAVKIFPVPGGGSTHLCWDAPDFLIRQCGSSLRYKSDVKDFTSGLNLLNRMRPVSFNWKTSGKPDFGLVAEEVAEVEPLLVTHNDKGEIEGVKYDRVGVVLINAVKEQQEQIEFQKTELVEQRKLIERQRKELDALKMLVCSQTPAAAPCKPDN